jgi:general secretion pathway protein G
MKRKAFTLIEILIVVVILGILAAIVIPKFSGASDVARASMLADDLRMMRTQFMVYKSQHHSASPGYPGGDPTATPTADDVIDQMTHSSNAAGTTGAIGTAGLNYGPYFSRFPSNPLNNLTTILVIDGAGTIPAASDTHGWVYQPSTMTLKADSTGTDEQGRAFYNY